jgi:hypothetical protein
MPERIRLMLCFWIVSQARLYQFIRLWKAYIAQRNGKHDICASCSGITTALVGINLSLGNIVSLWASEDRRD